MKPNASFEKLLLAFFAFIGLLIISRIIYSGTFNFIFLSWNIFLAWIPCQLSYMLLKTDPQKKWQQRFLLATWLLFFPNALYIITDLIHLDLETSVPKWFDVILLFTSAVVGLMLAFISLFRIEKYLANTISEKKLPWLILGILFLGSFGVYLGRFLRWNSWDILSNPLGLISTIAQRFIFPVQHFRTWCVTIMLTALFYLLYQVVKKMPAYISQPSSRY